MTLTLQHLISRTHLLLVIKINGCFVTNILTEPIHFAQGSSLINVNRPVWVICP